MLPAKRRFQVGREWARCYRNGCTINGRRDGRIGGRTDGGSCKFPSSCSFPLLPSARPFPSSCCGARSSLCVLAPGNRFRCILPPSRTVDFIPSLLGISISSLLFLLSRRRRRRRRRHDGTNPISFRIKHRFIITRARSVNRRPESERRLGGNFFGIPAGKISTRPRAFSSGRREGKKDFVETSSVALLPSLFPSLEAKASCA